MGACSSWFRLGELDLFCWRLGRQFGFWFGVVDQGIICRESVQVGPICTILCIVFLDVKVTG